MTKISIISFYNIYNKATTMKIKTMTASAFLLYFSKKTILMNYSSITLLINNNTSMLIFNKIEIQHLSIICLVY